MDEPAPPRGPRRSADDPITINEGDEIGTIVQSGDKHSLSSPITGVLAGMPVLPEERVWAEVAATLGVSEWAPDGRGVVEAIERLAVAQGARASRSRSAALLPG